MMFKDGIDAGYQLSLSLKNYANRDDVMIMAASMAGAVVGYSLHRELNLPLAVMDGPHFGLPDLENKTVILLDEGLKQDHKLAYAVSSLKSMGCPHIVVATSGMKTEAMCEVIGLVSGVYSLPAVAMPYPAR